uniref:Uncharacterized protein n=1 Tax=Arundo donax TaxID=35708 RepID=A0A0A9G790_ARUDO
MECYQRRNHNRTETNPNASVQIFSEWWTVVSQDLILLHIQAAISLNGHGRWGSKRNASSPVISCYSTQCLGVLNSPVKIYLTTELIDELEEGIKVHLLPNYPLTVSFQDCHAQVHVEVF